MKRRVMAGFLSTIILFPLFWYVYSKGIEDGVTRYKHSRQFELTLQSMYHFGLADCEEEKHALEH